MEEADLLKHLAILDYFLHLHLEARLGATLNGQVIAHDYALIISRMLTLLKRFSPQLPLDACLEERLRLAKLMGMMLFTSECQDSTAGEGPCCPEHWRQSLIAAKSMGNGMLPLEAIDRQIFILSHDWQEAKSLGITGMPSEGSWEVVRAELKRKYPLEDFKMTLFKVFREANAKLEAPLISKMSGSVMMSQDPKSSSPVKSLHSSPRKSIVNTPLKSCLKPFSSPNKPDPQLEFARVVKRWAEQDIQVHQAIHQTGEEVQAEWEKIYENGTGKESPIKHNVSSSPAKKMSSSPHPSSPSPMTQAPHQQPVDRKRKGRSLIDRHESAQKVQWTVSSNDDPNTEEMENSPAVTPIPESSELSRKKGRLLNPHPSDDDAQQQQRRGRRFWTNSEINNLKAGYQRFGPRWATIAASYHFEDRTPVDLKDKHRNLVLKYGEDFFRSYE